MTSLKQKFLSAGSTVSALGTLGVMKAQALTGVTQPGGFFDTLPNAINAILGYVMTFAGLLLLLYLIWGGVEWITSGGDKGKVESARNKITNAIIGIIVLAAAYAIANFVLGLLGATVDLSTPDPDTQG